MNKARSERANVALPAIGFGGASVGNLFRRVSPRAAERAVDTAWSAGIRYFDTAPYYGLGLSESRLGVALSQRDPAEYVLSTKVGKRLVDAPGVSVDGLVDGQWEVDGRGSSVRDYSRAGVLASLEGSLTRLGRDHIDIVYIHDPDDHLDQVETETAPVLSELRAQGVISAFGVGTSDWQVARRLGESIDLDLIMIAGRWTLADRSARPLVDWAGAAGVPLVAAAPFNSGLLASRRPSADARFEYAPASSRMLAFARELAAACESYGVPLPAAAIQFALRAPAVSSVVVGMASADEVTADCAAAATPIPDRLWAQLDRIAERYDLGG